MTPLHAEEPQNASPENVVRKFVAAYNNRDLDGMVQLSNPEIRWMSVTHEDVDTATSGTDELSDALSGYFSSPLASHSELLNVEVLGNSVTTIEKANWKSLDGESRSQCSVAVYMTSAGRIDSVWYFPEQVCP